MDLCSLNPVKSRAGSPFEDKAAMGKFSTSVLSLVSVEGTWKEGILEICLSAVGRADSVLGSAQEATEAFFQACLNL